jgi:SAM-dependent methyltransferase
MGRQLLVNTETTDLELDGYALVLKHRTIPFVSHCYEWCGEMLKTAALSVLELERELLKNELTLQDAHPYNVLFDGPTPIWVDLGSLVPVCREQPWYAYEEFLAYYTRPLKIIATGYPGIARSLLRNGGSKLGVGVQQADMEAITGTAFADVIERAKRRAKAVASRALPAALRPLARHAARSLPVSVPFGGTEKPISKIESAIREIETMRLVPSWTASSNCGFKDFPDFATTTGWTKKHCSIAQIISVRKPVSVLDIGSGDGWYSQFAARNGARVVSIDCDEPSVTKVFFDAARGQLPILPLLADFRSLNPMTAWAAAPGQAYVDRLSCDMVLALGLVHHLVFEQSVNFDLIVRGLSAFARDSLVVEFRGREDPWVRDRPNDRVSWYNLENFLTALKCEFREMKKFPADNTHRCVLFCEK